MHLAPEETEELEDIDDESNDEVANPASSDEIGEASE